MKRYSTCCMRWGSKFGYERAWSALSLRIATHRPYRSVQGATLVQVHLCFHGNGGISLPAWVLEIGTHNPDIFFSDRQHDHSLDCLSIGIDEGVFPVV